MDRRAFIVGTAGGVVAGMSGPAGAEVPAQARIATYVTNLRDFAGSGPLPAPGTRLSLARVIDRSFDPQSVAVEAPDGRRLGYLPAAHGRVLAPLIDAGLRFGATAAEAREGAVPSLTLELVLEQTTNPLS